MRRILWWKHLQDFECDVAPLAEVDMHVSSGILATDEEHSGFTDVVVARESRGSQDVLILAQGLNEAPEQHDVRGLVSTAFSRRAATSSICTAVAGTPASMAQQ